MDKKAQLESVSTFIISIVVGTIILAIGFIILSSLNDDVSGKITSTAVSNESVTWVNNTYSALSITDCLSLSCTDVRTQCTEPVTGNSNTKEAAVTGVWNKFNTSNNTKLTSIVNITLLHNAVLNVTNYSITGGNNQSYVTIDYTNINNDSDVKLWNGTYGVNEMTREQNWSFYNITATAWVIRFEQNFTGTNFNLSFTRNVSAGFNLYSTTDVTALCGAGCASYETNESTGYNANNNVSQYWRVYNSYLGGNNWTIFWTETNNTCLLGKFPSISTSNYTCSISGIKVVNSTGLKYTLTNPLYVDYLCQEPNTAYEATADNITNLSKIPTWIGIIIVVALAFIVLGFFYKAG